MGRAFKVVVCRSVVVKVLAPAVCPVGVLHAALCVAHNLQNTRPLPPPPLPLPAAALLGCPVVCAPAEVDFEQWGPEFVPGEGFRDSSEMHLEGPTVSALLEPFQPSTWGEPWFLHS